MADSDLANASTLQAKINGTLAINNDFLLPIESLVIQPANAPNGWAIDAKPATKN